MSPRRAHGIAALWGFAEATLFFLVPDVFLTALATRRPGLALRASGSALLGALLGGLVLIFVATRAPEATLASLTHVPGIDPELLEDVRADLETDGAGALLVGPALGRPYKLFAALWPATVANVPLFVALSIPARWLRFALTIALARGLVRGLEPLARRWQLPDRWPLILWLLSWSGFYVFYFRHFGW